MSADRKDNVGMREEYKEIDVAKVESCDIGFDDHGLFLIFARFIYQKKGTFDRISRNSVCYRRRIY